MKSHIIPLLLLIGLIYAALIAAHSHDLIDYYLDESSGSGNNSAEEFMNEMVPTWQEDDNLTDSISDAFSNEEKVFLGPRIERKKESKELS